MTAFYIIVSFALGFVLGVLERKVDRVKVNPQTVKNKITQIFRNGAKSEILITPSDEENEKKESKEFYDKMR